MGIKNILNLLALGAMWGASYLFIRLAIQDFGPILIAELRLLIASIIIFLFLISNVKRRQNIDISYEEWAPIILIGIFNSALPFCLIAFAMQNLTAGMGSILNATAPIWGGLVAFVWLKVPLSVWRMIGLVMGVLGVAVLVGNHSLFGFSGVGVEVLAILAATLSYGASASYIKKLGSKLAPLKMTFGSMLSGAVFLMPLAYYCWPVAPIFLSSWMAVIGLGAISTAYAYVLYFKLIEEIGPAQAIASTFLIPVFGMLFGELFLQEETSLRMIVGACIILIGTALSIGFIRPDLLLKRFKKS